MPFHDNGLLFLTTLLVIQIYDLEHDSRCERHTVFATMKCFRSHMLLEICSKCEILLKCCPKCVQNSAPNSKKCSKGAQRNRERPTHQGTKRKKRHRETKVIIVSSGGARGGPGGPAPLLFLHQT